METGHKLKQRIMRRVYALYVLRTVTSPALRLAALAVVLFVLSRIISVKDVLSNALHTSGVEGFMRLFVSAVGTTEMPVLFLTTLASALVVWFITDQVYRLVGMHEPQLM